jgi:hypothetical protein
MTRAKLVATPGNAGGCGAAVAAGTVAAARVSLTVIFGGVIGS